MLWIKIMSKHAKPPLADAGPVRGRERGPPWFFMIRLQIL